MAPLPAVEIAPRFAGTEGVSSGIGGNGTSSVCGAGAGGGKVEGDVEGDVELESELAGDADAFCTKNSALIALLEIGHL